MIWLRVESPSTSHPLPLPLPVVLPHTRASMAMIRAAALSTYVLAPRSETPPSGTPPLLPIPLLTSSPPLLLPSTDYSIDVTEAKFPPLKRLCIALGPKYEIEESSSLTDRRTRGFRADYGFVGTLDAKIRRDLEREIGYGITDIWEDPDETAEEIPMTDVAELGQRMTNFVTTVRQDTDEIYRRLDDEQDDRSLMNASREAWVQSMDTSDTTRSEVGALRTTMAALQSQQTPDRDPAYPDVPEEAVSVADALAACDTDRSRNGKDNHDSGTGVRRQAPLARETVGHDVAYAMNWTNLKNKMTDKYCPRGEIKKLEELPLMCARMFPEKSDKIERYVGGLPDMIHGSVMSSKPKTMHDAIEFATELMDKKISTFAERQAENMRKAYTSGSGEKKPYGGSKPLCSICKYHHHGQCAPKCNKCNKVVHLARNCRSTANANTANNQRGTKAGQKATRFEYGAQGHFKRECPKLKNNNRGNPVGSGNAPAKVYVVGHAGTNLDSNVATSTLHLNNHYASILFDTGADRSFMSTAFSSQIDIMPTTLDHYYDVELADGRIIGLNTIIRGCTLNLLNHPFNINLMPKIVRIPYGNETLIVRGDGSDRGNETRMNIILCTKTQKYILKGCHVFLARGTTKNTKYKSEGKRLEDELIVQNFPEVFPEDLPGLPPTRQVEFQINMIPGAAPVA
ncbi:putative reverse transcriptase domain-containing protein [Tanacetum coccineum]